MSFDRSSFNVRMFAIAATFALALIPTASFAHAADQEALCTNEALRLCTADIPNVERVTVCMIRQRASLSEGCKSLFQPATAPVPVSYRSTASKPVNLVPKMR